MGRKEAVIDGRICYAFRGSQLGHYRKAVELCDNSTKSGPRAEEVGGANEAGPIKRPDVHRELAIGWFRLPACPFRDRS